MSNDSLSERDQFFSKLSHDLRGSFTSILGFSDILNDPNEKLTYEEITEYVSRIGNQTRESYELLINFINWLKLDTYKYGLTKENLNLLDLILQAKNYYKKVNIEKKIEIKIDIDDEIKLLLDYEIANSIINNIFLFLNRITKNNSVIFIKSIKTDITDIATIEFTTNFSDENLSYLNNLKLEKLNSDVSFPILFAIKFAELCDGNLNFFQDLDNTLKIELHLPS